MTGLLGLKGLCKKYEFEMEYDRVPLFDIVRSVFPILGNLVNMVLNIDNAQAYEVLYLICKIFFISNQLIISPYLTEESNLDPGYCSSRVFWIVQCQKSLRASLRT
jgi:hypothetical protein